MAGPPAGQELPEKPQRQLAAATGRAELKTVPAPPPQGVGYAPDPVEKK